MAASFSPSYVQGGSWSSSGGTVSTNYGRLAINSVSLDTSTGKIAINYTLSIRKSNTSTAGYNLARIQGWINGESIGNYQGAEYNWYDSSWYNGAVDHKDYKTGTYYLTWNGSSSQNVTIAVRSLQDWGYTDSRWGQDNLCSRGSTTLAITGLITNPTIDSTSVTSNANGALTYSYTSTAGTGTINGQTWTFKNSGGTTLATKTDASGTVTGLGNNNNITWSLAITASDGGSASDSGSVYTRHNAPTIGTVTTTPTRSGSTYNVALSYSVTYDNTSYSSHTCVYGTSTSYGSSASSTGTGTTASWSITGLEPNKTYYYKITETDNGGNVTTSNTKTGSFTTPGNNPTISNVSFTPGETSASFTFSASADTNASISSRTIEWGTTTSYGSSQSLNANSGTITNLAGATKYYYKITVTDNKGKSSTSTGDFTTLSYAPRSINLIAEEIKSNSIKVSWSFDVPAGAPASAVTLYIKENGQTERTQSITPVSTTNYTVTSLAVDNDVSFALGVTNSAGTTKSNYINVSTLLNAPTLSVDGNAISPFEIQVVASSTITPTRSRVYRFSNDGGQTWSNYQTSAVYTWTNLNEETTYNIGVGVKALHTGTYSGDIEVLSYQNITTPADQARVRIKKEGAWVQGKAWYKTGGTWKKVKKIYIKKNGVWVVNDNG